MKMFRIRHEVTGVILWTGSATNPLAARDAMAHEAGCYDLRAGGLDVEEIRD